MVAYETMPKQTISGKESCKGNSSKANQATHRKRGGAGRGVAREWASGRSGGRGRECGQSPRPVTGRSVGRDPRPMRSPAPPRPACGAGLPRSNGKQISAFFLFHPIYNRIHPLRTVFCSFGFWQISCLSELFREKLVSLCAIIERTHEDVNLFVR